MNKYKLCNASSNGQLHSVTGTMSIKLQSFENIRTAHHHSCGPLHFLAVVLLQTLLGDADFPSMLYATNPACDGTLWLQWGSSHHGGRLLAIAFLLYVRVTLEGDLAGV